MEDVSERMSQFNNLEKLIRTLPNSRSAGPAHTPIFISNSALELCYLLPGWDTEFFSSSPFAWQSNRAIIFYFIQNSVSEI